MNVGAVAKCPGCEGENKIALKRPSFCEVSTVFYECNTCKSTIRVNAKRGKKDPKQVDINSKVVKISYLLRDLKGMTD